MMNVYKSLLNKKVTYIDSTKLIDAIQNDSLIYGEIDKVVEQVVDKDSLVLLGCTHLIAIKEEFRNRLNNLIISQDEIFIEMLK